VVRPSQSVSQNYFDLPSSHNAQRVEASEDEFWSLLGHSQLHQLQKAKPCRKFTIIFRTEEQVDWVLSKRKQVLLQHFSQSSIVGFSNGNI